MKDGTGHTILKSSKKKLYFIDDEILRPYFSLENVENAIFGLADNALWYQVCKEQYNSRISS